jgi:hypothetical protein
MAALPLPTSSKAAKFREEERKRLEIEKRKFECWITLKYSVVLLHFSFHKLV